MMTMPYYGTMTTAKAHGKTVQEQNDKKYHWTRVASGPQQPHDY